MAVKLFVWGRVFHRQLFHADVQLLGQQLRLRGVGALPHFDVRHDQRHRPRGSDAYESVGRPWLAAFCSTCGQRGAVEAEADDQAAADHGDGLQECTAGLAKIPDCRGQVFVAWMRAHVALPCPPTCCAASLMAPRMRSYVPQRQMLPLMTLSISLSVGAALPASSAAADISWPDWQ